MKKIMILYCSECPRLGGREARRPVCRAMDSRSLGGSFGVIPIPEWCPLETEPAGIWEAVDALVSAAMNRRKWHSSYRESIIRLAENVAGLREARWKK